MCHQLTFGDAKFSSKRHQICNDPLKSCSGHNKWWSQTWASWWTKKSNVGSPNAIPRWSWTLSSVGQRIWGGSLPRFSPLQNWKMGRWYQAWHGKRFARHTVEYPRAVRETAQRAPGGLWLSHAGATCQKSLSPYWVRTTDSRRCSAGIVRRGDRGLCQ